MRRRNGFTLVELLVVIGIVTVLIGILLPVIGKARTASKRTTCAVQLRELGYLFNMYLNENKQRVPRVNPVPSQKPPLVAAPSIYEVLDRYTRGARGGYRCPADRITQPATVGIPGGFDTYFEREGGSYEYNAFFNAFAFDEVTGVNKVWRYALHDALQQHQIPAGKVIVFQDFEPFHGKAGQPGARNRLFADFHVGDLEKSVK